MKPYFAGHPVAAALCAGTLVLWAGIEGRQALTRRTDGTNMDRGSRLVLGLSWTAALVLTALARAKVPAAAFPDDAVLFGIGLAVIWIGIGLRWWSFRSLGRYFTFEVVTSADQPVITTGPYGLVRHPSYAGLLLIFVGGGLMEANWLSLAALILLPFAGLAYRIRVEEAALSAMLGEAYQAYADNHKRIVPFVW